MSTESGQIKKSKNGIQGRGDINTLIVFLNI
jgi:hypothetical protein